MATKATTFTIPKTLAACADAYYTLRAKRLEMQKAVDAVEKQEKEVAAHLINNLQKETTGVAGKIARVYVEAEEIPVVADRDKFLAWVFKFKSYEFLPKSVNKAPIKERWEAGEKVPGIDVEYISKLHFSKL